jgi:hypothetical protein
MPALCPVFVVNPIWEDLARGIEHADTIPAEAARIRGARVAKVFIGRGKGRPVTDLQLPDPANGLRVTGASPFVRR